VRSTPRIPRRDEEQESKSARALPDCSAAPAQSSMINGYRGSIYFFSYIFVKPQGALHICKPANEVLLKAEIDIHLDLDIFGQWPACLPKAKQRSPKISMKISPCNQTCGF
jgi:hypothetical protein